MSNEHKIGFKVTDQKGFHITFENGWTVSVQFGRGNYADNYDHPEYGTPVPKSGTAEVAAWPRGGAMVAIDDGDTVGNRWTPAQVLALLNAAASAEPDATALDAALLAHRGDGK